VTLAEFDPPERFVAGTVGPPGQRTFFLQARGGGRVVSLSLEKVQVSVLAERITELLDGVSGVGFAELSVDNDPLDTPIEDSFRVTTMALSWDSEREVVVIECHDRDLDDEDEAEPDEVPVVPEGEPQTVRVVLGPAPAREFARRCAAVVAAGRPPCPFCGQPLDPDGHICPRANGYRR
jgi:uncharacterized repeat protein (TIGR03847 family)